MNNRDETKATSNKETSNVNGTTKYSSLGDNYLLQENGVDVTSDGTCKYNVTSEKYRILGKWLMDYMNFATHNTKNSEQQDSYIQKTDSNIIDFKKPIELDAVSLADSNSTFRFDMKTGNTNNNSSKNNKKEPSSFTKEKVSISESNSDLFQNNENNNMKRYGSQRKKMIVAIIFIAIFIAAVITLIAVLISKFVVTDGQKCSKNCTIGFEPILMNSKCICVDVDECKNSSNVCVKSKDEICKNTVGSYVCTTAYKEYCDAACISPNTCKYSNSSYSCDCAVGFEYKFQNNRSECVDVNECTENSLLYRCPSPTHCNNINGTYECCLAGTVNDESDTCYSCGLQYNKPISRIIGGTDTIPYSWPWTVIISLQFQFDANKWINVTNLCGGVLISPNYVLTAAHCVNPRSITLNQFNIRLEANAYHKTYESIYKIYIGVHNQTGDRDLPDNLYSIQSIRVHPDFNPTHLINDIAIVELSRPVQRSIKKDWICVDNGQKFIASKIETDIYIAGFGSTDGLVNKQTNILQQANIEIQPFSVCRSYLEQNRITNDNSQLCAGYLNGTKDACYGDSGSALMYKHIDRWYAVGLVSYGQGCGEPNKPGVYTMISYYYDWINGTIFS